MADAIEEGSSSQPTQEVHQDQGQLLWSIPDTKGDSPSKRSGHSLSMIGSNLFIFGGLNSDGKPGPVDELWCLKTQGDAFEWSLISPAGECPLPRWKHSASVYGNQLVVFGGFHSSTNRSNDTFLFDTVSLTWSRPIDAQGEFTPRGNHMPTKNAWPFTPSPRGAHSATVLGDVIYIFGGYGGQGYGRRDFNDMFQLDLKDWTWSKTQCRGKSPDPRSSHAACRVESSIFVHGGWNAVQQFNDLHIFDTVTNTWTEADVSSNSPPCWNHGACAVEAIPNWKLFVFGGCSGKIGYICLLCFWVFFLLSLEISSCVSYAFVVCSDACACRCTNSFSIFFFSSSFYFSFFCFFSSSGELGAKTAQGTYRNEVQVLDTGTMVWNSPNVEGKFKQLKFGRL